MKQEFCVQFAYGRVQEYHLIYLENSKIILRCQNMKSYNVLIPNTQAPIRILPRIRPIPYNNASEIMQAPIIGTTANHGRTTESNMRLLIKFQG